MKVYRTRITPKMAAQYLRGNDNNRPITQRIVEHYARQMRDGLWKLTGEAIKFDKHGTLIDGQHRLQACIMANVAFETYIVEGVESDAFNCLDQGNVRTMAHCFGRDKKSHYNMLAAAVRMLWLLENRENIQGGRRLLIDEGYEVLGRHPVVEKICELVSKWRNADSPLVSSVCVAFATWTYEKHGDRALDFWRRVMTGEELVRGSPEHMLYRKLRNGADDGQPAGRTNTRLIHRDARTAYCVKAFNAYITGKRLGALKFNMGREEIPEFA